MSERWTIGWGGFVGDKLDWIDVDTGFGGFGIGLVRMPAIFRTKKEARREYQDVRRIAFKEPTP